MINTNSAGKLADENNKELPNNFFKETFGMRNEFIIPNYFADWIGDEGEDKIKNLADRKEEIYRRIIIGQNQPLTRC